MDCFKQFHSLANTVLGRALGYFILNRALIFPGSQSHQGGEQVYLHLVPVHPVGSVDICQSNNVIVQIHLDAPRPFSYWRRESCLDK